MRARCAHHIAQGVERTQQTSLLRMRPPPPGTLGKGSRDGRAAEGVRGSAATAAERRKGGEPDGAATASRARYNALGVQHISAHIHQQLFPDASQTTPSSQPSQGLVHLAEQHLRHHDLLGKTTSGRTDPISFDLPPLHGRTLDEHFHRLGLDAAEPYLSLAMKYARASAPPKPRRWVRESGWTKYHPDGSTEAVPAPDADVLTFDVEVMWRETSFPAMACAASATHWYAWISPWLLGESESDRHLIPLGDKTKERIVVGHNIGYDRARVLEEYDLQPSRNFFVDTMSLHVAVNGMCSRQRPSWTKARKARELQDRVASEEEYDALGSLVHAEQAGQMESEEDLWVGRSSANSLRDVAKFHCNIVIDKSQRECFGELNREGVVARLDDLLTYCAADVEVTHKVYKQVFPLFLSTCPHPVSFAALRHLSAEILPVNQGWDAYVANAEATYHRLSSAVEERLVDLAEKALEHKADRDVYETDPWLSQLDWSGQEIRMVKGKKKGDPMRPAARQKKPGCPKWYRELFPKADGPINLTVRTRIAPLLLRLAWDGHPLVWSDQYGWTFRVPRSQAGKYAGSMQRCDMDDDPNAKLRDDFEHAYFKLPHADGPKARVASPMAKGFGQYFDNGTLGSEYAYAREALEMNQSCSYWISARDRITKQMVVYAGDLPSIDGEGRDLGFILPQVIPMGTITRRAVENTWLTAANAKENRVGSELKAMVTAPPGHCFVGADVDSQELWIASLVGDANFSLHGGGALGFMTLEGTKAAGTDLHSRTAKILGISRNDAKVFNYGRIYGAGLAFAQTLLRRFNPRLSEAEAAGVAKTLYEETKGKKMRNKSLRPDGGQFWFGGTESLVFNRLEEFAQQERPRTPVLGAGITEALMKRYLATSFGGWGGGEKRGGNNYLTSRINWAIQSSGVDYLHLLIVSMDYLIRRYALHARLALTVHDEIRYLAREDDKYRTAMALQVANLWTRAMFSQQMGIEDLPQSCAFFSAVDIDSVLRKEVDMDCVTPSHPTPIPPGESLDIAQLLAKGPAALLDESMVPAEDQRPRPERFAYVPRVPVMEGLASQGQTPYLRAQIARSKEDVLAIVSEISGKGPRRKGAPRTSQDDARPAAPPAPEKAPPATKPARKPRAATRVSARPGATPARPPVARQAWFKASPSTSLSGLPPEEVGFDGYDSLPLRQAGAEGNRKLWDVGLMSSGVGLQPHRVPATTVMRE